MEKHANHKEPSLVHSEDPSGDHVELDAVPLPQSLEEIDSRLERRVVRKLDTVMIPLLALSFMFAYLVSPILSAIVVDIGANQDAGSQQHR